MNVLPIEIQGALRFLTNEYIGPVPAFETFKIELPKDSLAASWTWATNGFEGSVLAAASP